MIRTRRKGTLLTALALACCTLGAALPAAPRATAAPAAAAAGQVAYTVTDLGTLGGSYSYARSINNNGQVVGYAADGNGRQRAFIYANGTMSPLPTLSSSYPNSLAWSVNDSGQAVGSSNVDRNNTYGTTYYAGYSVSWGSGTYYYYYNPTTYSYRSTENRAVAFNGGSINNLGVLGSYTSSGSQSGYYYYWYPGMQYSQYGGTCCGTVNYTNTYSNSEARGINNSGQIVGQSLSSDNSTRAFIYQDGVMSALDTLGGTYSHAFAINNSGQVVGQSNTLGNQYTHAFLWTGPGQIQDLGTLGGTHSNARGVSDNGKVVGGAYTANNSAQHAFIWDGSGLMQDLGTLGYDSWAEGVNDAGQVVGTSYSTQAADYRAFVYDAANGMRDLNTLIPVGTGWTLREAFDINESGQIVGYGVHNGYTRAFLLTPASNTAPALGAIGDQTAKEGHELTFTASAADSDAPAQTLTFSLDAGAPAGASIDPATGVFTWTPTLDQGPGDYSLTVRVTDSASPALDDSETISIHVDEDAAPEFASVAAQTVDEGAELSFTLSATDADGDALTYGATSLPAGAVFDPATGGFKWTPTEEQGAAGGSAHTATFSVTDGYLSDEETVNITVNEVNSAPVLAAVGGQTVDELAQLTFTASATDEDLPSNGLTYSLAGAPAGATIDPSTGAFSWTPTEEQGTGAAYTFTVRVSDSATPALSDEEEISVTVKEVNVAPALSPIGGKTVDELSELTFSAQATDADRPANTLAYSLVGAPAGATIDSATGAFSWTPTEAQGAGGAYTFAVKVTDGALADEEVVSVTVNEVNREPVLGAVGNKTVDELTELAFTASAADPDSPANNLTFSLVGAPAGAAIDPATGAVTWTPTEAQGGNPNTPYTFKVRVADGGSPELSDEEEITVTVREVNERPVLDAISDTTPYWGQTVAFTPSAADADLPANTLTYALTSPDAAGVPSDVSFDAATGTFSWTPGSARSSADYHFTVTVDDNQGASNSSASRSFTVTVRPHPTALTYTGDATGQYSDAVTLSAGLVDTLTNTALPGEPVSFQLGSQSANAPAGSGVSLTLSQAPALSYNVLSTYAGNGAYVGSGASDPFVITPEDARATYTGALYATANTSGGVKLTLSATVRDITEVAGDPATDAQAGDITKATVDFVNRDNGSVVCANRPVGLVTPDNAKVGAATCDWTTSIGNADAAQYTIGIVVKSYYTRNSSDENTVVSVAKSVPGLITGGGYILMSDPSLSAGLFPGAPGTKTNFGFNIRNETKNNAPKGNINVIVRNNGRVYQIKGNAMTSLGTRPTSTGGTATFNGKANIQDITDPLNVISIDGNATLQVTLTDNGAVGDMLSITVWNKGGGVWYASNWNGTKTVEQALGGGNLVVR